ncbi:sulfotransferase family 2 domain-containing protein [Novosphingobium sp. KACC 22771]|uniref:sulfotransferase family 2 domain-containing protein n=1 Tax=Novosphingobium sp. KACC 22771 TaxID=3025670 RepID=UPI0023659763|nr:sulfotransferase family 2 domain-containing protein [Novosphingobium sp. KACC 22771]WDF71921.1 sulfotransferase family 2 domain-containing protein [Novosphingobium sp. KACC 22771]
MKMHASRLVFCHVPKTAGSSITRLLRDNWPGPHALDVYEEEDGQTDLAVTLRDCAMLAGHLSQTSVLGAMRRAGVEAFKLTSLRNPVDHVLSQYYHIQAYAGAALAGDARMQALKDAAGGMSLLEWMSGRARGLDGFEVLFDNPQIRMILNKKEGPVTLADARAAIGVMREFDGVILFERLGESVAAVLGMLGMEGGGAIPRLMTNPAKGQSVVTMTRPELQAAMALTRYDAVLYDVIGAEWGTRMAAMSAAGAAPVAPIEQAAPVLLADVLRTSNAQRIEGGTVGDTIKMQGDGLLLHPPHGREGALRIASADFRAQGQAGFSTELMLEHPAAPDVELAMTIREGERIVAGFTTRVSRAASVPVALRFAPIIGRCFVDLELRSLGAGGCNDYAGLMMRRAVFG